MNPRDQDFPVPRRHREMEIGTKVVRGNDWTWEDQDGGDGEEGEIIREKTEDGWVKVYWFSSEQCYWYRMGHDDKYDLNWAGTVPFNLWH